MARVTLERSVSLLLFSGGMIAMSIPVDGQSTPVPLRPEEIYLRAVRAMKDEPLPAFVTFREHIAGRNSRSAAILVVW